VIKRRGYSGSGVQGIEPDCLSAQAWRCCFSTRGVDPGQMRKRALLTMAAGRAAERLIPANVLVTAAGCQAQVQAQRASSGHPRSKPESCRRHCASPNPDTPPGELRPVQAGWRPNSSWRWARSAPPEVASAVTSGRRGLQGGRPEAGRPRAFRTPFPGQELFRFAGAGPSARAGFQISLKYLRGHRRYVAKRETIAGATSSVLRSQPEGDCLSGAACRQPVGPDGTIQTRRSRK